MRIESNRIPIGAFFRPNNFFFCTARALIRSNISNRHFNRTTLVCLSRRFNALCVYALCLALLLCSAHRRIDRQTDTRRNCYMQPLYKQEAAEIDFGLKKKQQNSNSAIFFQCLLLLLFFLWCNYFFFYGLNFYPHSEHIKALWKDIRFGILVCSQRFGKRGCWLISDCHQTRNCQKLFFVVIADRSTSGGCHLLFLFPFFRTFVLESFNRLRFQTDSLSASERKKNPSSEKSWSEALHHCTA